MIIVEKQAQGGGANASRYAQSLATYMRTAKRGAEAADYGMTLAVYMRRDAGEDRNQDATKGERVLATGGRMQKHAVAWEAAMAEMHERLAKRSSRSKKPAHHLVGSYREGEEPSAADCDEVARALTEELGCDAGLILWALHGDTDNRHLHLLVLTLDEEGHATPYGPQGQSHEAMQRAIARIEHTQGLTREQHGRYEVINGVVKRSSMTIDRAKTRPPIRTEVLQWEDETGLESFTRYAQRELASLLETAASWDEAQTLIAPHGAMVMKSGSGGEIRTGDGSHRAKLSNVDRALAWKSLEKRWGEWSEPTTTVAPYLPRIMNGPRAVQWLERDQKAEMAHDKIQGRIDALRAERVQALNHIRDEGTARKADLAALVAEPGDVYRLELGMRAIYRRRATSVDTEYRNRIAALCDLREDVADAPDFDTIDLDDLGAPECSLAISWSMRPAEPQRVAGFTAMPVGKAIQYWKDGDPGRSPAFVERGDRIWIHDRSDAALRAALFVAKARYGDVAAFGDAAFIARAQLLGRQMGIDVQEGVTPKPKPPRQRSVRVALRREAVRRWQQDEAVARRERLQQRSWAQVLAMLDRTDDDPRTPSLRTELPGRPLEIADFERTAVEILMMPGVLLAEVSPGDPPRPAPDRRPQPSGIGRG